MKIVLGMAALVVLVGVVLFASATLDTPSKSTRVERVIDASREDVWAELADIDSYADWNPYITEASGDLRVGGELRIVLSPPGKETVVSVLTATFERKIRTRDRLVLPGVRDEEMTFRVVKLTPASVRLEETVRVEGLLSLFTDLEPTTQALELMADALARRVEASQ